MADVQLDDLSRVYPDGTRAVAGLTLYVRDRELLAVVGPSGCGKSTALRMVAGIEPIDGGTVTIGGRVVNGLKPHERDVAMVFERGALYPHLTAAENLRFGLTARRLPETEIEQRVAAEARVLGLQRLLDRLPRTLSAGQRQRVALGRATVRVPRVFLLDEPLTHMDAGERTRLRSELAQLQHGLGVTTIYVTHDQAQAMAIGDRVAVMRAGRIEQVANPRTLYHQPANAFVASFLGSPAMALVAGGLETDAGRTWVRLGSQRLGFPGTPSGRLRGRVGRPVTVGVRPEHLHEAAGARPGAAVLRATVARVERLGHETLAACAIDAQPVLVTDTPGVADQPGGERALLTARLSGHHRARPGDPVDLSVDTARLSFFDPVSGDALWHPG
ncbi:MAG TPA: ATP-binding cassette domain-containing protein [Actinomycetes bacterium]|jgi:multiple sugar transport system ATP-binding protein|nr:ATP-binding cassette domain-containing protein [Actinomycetes bacterium]